MNIMSMSCASCGAPIQIPPDVDQLNCAHCGTALIVQRGEGYVALKVAEHLTKAIRDSSRQTSAAISEGTQVTQAELKRLQLTQELATATAQLGNIQAQLRYLQSQKQNRKNKKQIAEWRVSEANIIQNINILRSILNPISTTMTQKEKPSVSKEPATSSPFTRGFLTFWFVTFFVFIMLTAFLSQIPILEQNNTLSKFILSIVILVSLAAGLYTGYRAFNSGNAIKPPPSQEQAKVSEAHIPPAEEFQNSNQ